MACASQQGKHTASLAVGQGALWEDTVAVMAALKIGKRLAERKLERGHMICFERQRGSGNEFQGFA